MSLPDAGPRPAADPRMIRAAKVFYFAEQAGGVIYRRFADSVENADVRAALDGFGGDEYQHADWYLTWLLEHGAAPPRLESLSFHAARMVDRLTAPRSLEARLGVFSDGESAAARHLRKLVTRIHDASLRAIVERTIPVEQRHADWLPHAGCRMLRPADRRGRSWFDLRRAGPSV
jgi:rubrerythrin